MAWDRESVEKVALVARKFCGTATSGGLYPVILLGVEARFFSSRGVRSQSIAFGGRPQGRPPIRFHMPCRLSRWIVLPFDFRMALELR